MGDRRADAGVPIHGGHALRYNALNWPVKADTPDAPCLSHEVGNPGYYVATSGSRHGFDAA